MNRLELLRQMPWELIMFLSEKRLLGKFVDNSLGLQYNSPICGNLEGLCYTRKCRYMYRQTYVVDYFAACFVWNETPEGFIFWRTAYEDLKKKMNKTKLQTIY